MDGQIQYSHPEKTAVMTDVLVNDGQWHYIEVIWMSSELHMTLDYGQIQVNMPPEYGVLMPFEEFRYQTSRC